MELSNFNLKYVRLCDLDIPRDKWLNCLQNSGDPDQMLHSAVSDLCLYCLPMPFLWDARHKWVNVVSYVIREVTFIQDRQNLCLYCMPWNKGDNCFI